MMDTVWELSCNLDDMTPEDIAFAMERLLEAGALDVWTAPIGMKKNRPGVLLSVLCREAEKEALAQLLFRHTTTLGVRLTEHQRYLLRREQATAATPWGPVGVKAVEGRYKPEFEDLRAIALRENLPIATVRREAEKAFDSIRQEHNESGGTLA